MFENKPKFFHDDRGTFCDITSGKTNFNIKRVYVCENFKKGTIRGFHYHEKEEKLFYVPRGAVKFIIIKCDIIQAKAMSRDVYPTSDLYEQVNNPEIFQTFILSDKMHNGLYIPANYANAWMTLTDDTILVGCSSSTLEESVDDDIRFSPDKPIFKELWKVKNR